MSHSLKNIASIIILLLSWAFFVSPASSVTLPTDEQHQLHSNIPLCDSESCLMHFSSAQSCAEHCESLSFIAIDLIINNVTIHNSITHTLDDSKLTQQYPVVELKPPIQL